MGWCRNTAKRAKKNIDERQRKYVKKHTKKTGKSTATLGKNAEISAKKALKIHKMPSMNTAKQFKNKNSEKTAEYTKHIKDTRIKVTD